MPQNFFITGMPKSGKTTLLTRLVDELKAHGLRVGGFISPEEKTHGTRTGFYVMDVESGAIGLLADVNADGPMVSKYHVDIKSFEGIALPSLKKYERYDVVVIDEIGRMELKSRKFSDMLDIILDSPTPLIASLHNDFVERYAQSGEVIFLEESNREAAYADLAQRIKAIGRKVQKKAVKKEKAARREAVAGRKAGAMPARKKALVQERKGGPAPVKKAKPAKAKPGRKEEAVRMPEKKGKLEKKLKKPKRGGEKGLMGQIKELLGF